MIDAIKCNYRKIVTLILLIFFCSFSLANATPIELYSSFEGNIGLVTAGNSELNETGGTGNCGNGDQTTDTISLPAGATVKAAYLYWYAMTKNQTSGDNYPFIEISNTAPVIFPASSEIITATRQFRVTKAGWNGVGNWKYSGRFADVTTQVRANPNGTYTVDVQGGASNSACANMEENVRAWNLVVVYEDAAIVDNKKIYIYDGLTGYFLESVTTSVSGFQVPATSTGGALTVISIQGDVGIPGEYMQTSDNAFPDFPGDFADGDHGPALDIDTLVGDFTPGSTSLNINSGTTQDLIFTTSIILTIPTVPTPPLPTSLTLVTEINNDQGGTATINDLSISTNAGSLAFDAGTTSSTNTIYTSSELTINAGIYELSANDYAGYTKGSWSCRGNQGPIVTGLDPADVNIVEGDHVTCTIRFDDTPVNPFSCDDSAYIGQGEPLTQLYRINTSISPYSVDTIGSPSAQRYNGLGFNVNDGLLYGFKTTGTPGLISIDASGTVTDLGAITGIPIPESRRYYDADMDQNNHLYYHDHEGTLYKINVLTKVATHISLSSNPSIMSDIAFNPQNDMLYGVPNREASLIKINPITGIVTSQSIEGLPVGIYGAQWFDAMGRFFILSNSTGTIYRIDNLNAPSVSAASPGLASSNNNDGARCSVAPLLLKTVSPKTTVAGGTVTFTYEIANALNTTMRVDFIDDLRSVSDFIGTPVDESATPVNGFYVPGTFSIIGASGIATPVFSNSNKTLTINQLSIPAKTTTMIQVEMVLPRDTNAGDYFSQAIINILGYGESVGGSLPAAGVSIYSDDPTQVEFPVPTVLTVEDTEPPEECDALIGNINAGLSPVSSLKATDKIFLGSVITASGVKTGHLKAFEVDADGEPKSSQEWDAHDEMNATKRTAGFYSSNSSNVKAAFNNLVGVDFGISDSAAAALKTSIYNASLAPLSTGSNLALITNEIDTLAYLDNPSYRSHYTDAVSQRKKRVLATSDDGFLYAFDQSNGELGWAWMPRSLLSELPNGTSSFKAQHYMQGNIDVLDLKNGTTYNSYIVGSYKQGLGQYVLRLSEDTASDLAEVIWDVDHSASKESAPNNGKRAYFKDGNNNAYTAYITTGASANSSTLTIRALTSNAAMPLVVSLSFTATSTPYVMLDVGSSTTKSIYLGDNVGNIYSASLLQSDGTLQSAGDIQADLGTVITSLNTDPTEGVQYIGSARSSTDSAYYLRAQSETRLTVFKYASGSWVRHWTTYEGGRNKWTGGSTAVDNDITPLLTGAKITDNAYIVADSLVLPIMERPDNNDCVGDSYYYFYKLTDGHFPANTFYNGNTALTARLGLGKGRTRRLQLTNLIGSDRLLGLGMSDQTATSAQVGINGSFTIMDPFTTGVRSWRELRD